jgi:hypothetical protein
MAFDIFLTAVNRENGSLSIDPLDALCYPFRTYQALRAIQDEFIVTIKKRQDELMAEQRRNAATGRRGRR